MGSPISSLLAALSDEALVLTGETSADDVGSVTPIASVVTADCISTLLGGANKP